MINPYLPKPAKILKIERQTPDIFNYTFAYAKKSDTADFSFMHGQFLMLGLNGFGEAPFDICSASVQTKTFDLAIRNVGLLTKEIHKRKVGDTVFIRGPFGNGLPAKNYSERDLLLIGGGSGFIVIRSFVLDYLAGKLPVNKLNVFYGCYDEQNLIFCQEFSSWKKKIDLDISLASGGKNWKGTRGVVTNLFNNEQDFTNTVCLVIGPPVMYKFVIEELQKKGVSDGDIYLSLERRMYCGVGVCQHCAIGPYYVCKDGPIFSWEQLKNIPGAI